MNIDISYVALVVIVVLLSMTVHEAMHAYMSNWLGDSTARHEGRLTLNPLKHIDPYMTIALPVILALVGAPIFGGAKPVPFNPMAVRYGEFGAALVGLAGPLTNLVLSFVAFTLWMLTGHTSTWLGEFLQLSVVVNLGFFIFNMLPIPPLDGSRALYAIAPGSVQRFMSLMEQQGILIVFALVLVFSSQIGQFIGSTSQLILQFYASLFGVKVV